MANATPRTEESPIILCFQFLDRPEGRGAAPNFFWVWKYHRVILATGLDGTIE
jgi:hypothetical protein